MRCLEFYSGLGGMHYALNQSFPGAEVVCAFDINTVANDVYQHNHGKRPHQGNIEKLSVEQLEAYNADLWLLAPPCQPYTLRGLQKDADDWRASSFMKLLLKLPHMQAPPRHLLVENVVGFGQSRTHAHMVQTMQAAGYAIQEFVVSPVQLRIPYSRPRYFAVMKKTYSPSAHKAAPFPLQGLADGAPFTDPPTVLMQRLHLCDATLTAQSAQTAALVQPVGSFLEAAWPCDAATQHQEATDAADESLLQTVPDSECGGEAHEGVEDGDSSHDVPKDVLIRWGHVLDIVTPVSCLTNCFTKTYTRYAKGCGSVLATQNIDTISFAYSTQQRCRTSQPFVKPRLIARPAQAPPRPSSAAADQKLPETAESIKEPAELAQQNNSFHSAVMGSCETLSAQEADCQAKQSSRTYLSGTAVSSDCAGSGGNSATQNSDCQGPEQKPLEGFPSGLFKPTQANEGSVCESGGGTRHLSSCASVSTQYGRCNACVEEEHVHEAADEAEGTADDSESEAAALLCWLEGLQLRYFTPREIANLHSFPASFSFPMHVTRRQQYALLGNSLSAAVVADLLTYLLTL